MTVTLNQEYKQRETYHDAATPVLLILIKVTMASAVYNDIKIFFSRAKTFTIHHLSRSVSQYQL